MKAMQASGNKYDILSASVSDLICATNYYLKSGYFSPTKQEISLIYDFYADLLKRIFFVKANLNVGLNINILYNVHCKIKRILASSVFVDVEFVRCNELLKHYNTSVQLENICKLYNKCKQVLEIEKASDKKSVTEHSHSFFKRDVFIGVIRNKQQLDICLEKGFYHIPVDMLKVSAEDVSYIAVYQSINMFGTNSGIRYYGKIDSYQVLKRKEITEIPKVSDRLYYKFNISKWHTLPKPISVNGGRPFETTSMYLLLTSKDAFELTFKDPTTCKLYRTIMKSVVSNRDKVACHYRNLTFAIENGVISVYKNRVKVYSVSTVEYTGNPAKHFWNMLKYRGNYQVK